MDKKKRKKSSNIDYLSIDIRKIKDLTSKNFIVIWTYKNVEKSKMNMNLTVDKLLYNFYFGNKPIENYINIVYTKCNYGNFRKWFICPECNNKKAVLYFKYNHHTFVCRDCMHINYISSQISKNNILTKINLRFEKILKKLKINNIKFNYKKPGYVPWNDYYQNMLFLNIIELLKLKKPKYMHLKTFELLKFDIKKLYSEINNFEDYNNYNPNYTSSINDSIILKEGFKTNYILNEKE
jgi:hypothetical protein